MRAFDWIKNRFKEEKSSSLNTMLQPYLHSGGIEISIKMDDDSVFRIESGSHVVIRGTEVFQKNYLIDWFLGYQEMPHFNIEFIFNHKSVSHQEIRNNLSVLIGRSPILFGEKIQDAIFFRTKNVNKEVTMYFIEKMYGSTLKSRTNPENPFLDLNHKPIPIYNLSCREHLEIQSINAILQQSPLVVIDTTSATLNTAIEEGFKLNNILGANGKTIITIVSEPFNKTYWEDKLSLNFTKELNF